MQFSTTETVWIVHLCTHSHPPQTLTHPTLTPPTHTHTPHYIHTYTAPNTPISPPPHTHTKALHYNIFKVSNLLQYTYCIAVLLPLGPTLHQHMNTVLHIPALNKVPFGSHRTNHHNAIHHQPFTLTQNNLTSKNKNIHTTTLTTTSSNSNTTHYKPRNPKTAKPENRSNLFLSPTPNFPKNFPLLILYRLPH